MKGKKLLSVYGLRFGISYIAGFFLLVTFYGRFGFPTFFGDILIKSGGITLYLPFTSSLAIAAFVTIMIEAYFYFKRY